MERSWIGSPPVTIATLTVMKTLETKRITLTFLRGMQMGNKVLSVLLTDAPGEKLVVVKEQRTHAQCESSILHDEG